MKNFVVGLIKFALSITVIIGGLRIYNTYDGNASPFVLSFLITLFVCVILTLILSGSKKKCPYCAEIIKKEARICRFCHKEQPIEDVSPPTPPVVVKARSTEELKQEIIRAREKGYSHYEISCAYNNYKDPLPKEYASQKKWSPSLVEQIENS
jgi:hypothetical protein